MELRVSRIGYLVPGPSFVGTVQSVYARACNVASNGLLVTLVAPGIAESGEVVVDKPGNGAFCATDLDLILHNRGIRSLIVCGVTTEVCVNTTVREANDRGYECVVLSDCVGSYSRSSGAWRSR